MDITLKIDGLNSIDNSERPQYWWRNTDYLGRIIKELQKVNLWQGFSYCYNLLANSGQEFDSIETLLKLSQYWESNQTYIFRQSEDSCDYMMHWMLNSPGIYCESPNSLAIYFKIEENYLQKSQNIKIEQIIDFVCNLHQTFLGVALLGPLVNVEVENISYPRVLPPRFLQDYFSPCLVNFFSRKFLAHCNKWEAEKIEKLLSLPMPSGCERIEQGDLVILRWVDNLHDMGHISQRLGLQDQWFVEILNPKLDPNYNQFGDRLANVPPTLIADNYVTFYEPLGGWAYQAIVLYENGQLEPEIMSQLREWLQIGQLPEHKLLQGVVLILPSRTTALRAREQVLSMDKVEVVYVDNKSNLWIPYPYASLSRSEELEDTTEVLSSYWFNPPNPKPAKQKTDAELEQDCLDRQAEREVDARIFVAEIFAYFQKESSEWLENYEPLDLIPPQDIQESICELLHEYREKEVWFYDLKIYPDYKTFIFYSSCTKGMPNLSEDRVLLITEFLSRVNWDIKFGCFELKHIQDYPLDFWEIRYKTSIECMGSQIDRALIRNIVQNNVSAFEKYLPVIRAIIQEDVSPAVAASWFKLPEQTAYSAMSDEEEAIERKLIQQLREEGLVRKWNLREEEEPSGTILEMDYVGYYEQFKCQLLVRNKRREFICYALYPRAVPPSKLLALAELFVLHNTDIGNFELDWDSSQLRYRTSIDFHGSQFNPVLAIRQAFICADLMDRNLPLLRLVIEEDVPPADAIAQIDGDSDEDEEFDEDYDDFEEQESFNDN